MSVAPDDEDWLAVVGRSRGIPDRIWVVASQDGGDNFTFAGAVGDTNQLRYVFDLDVSIEVDGIHNIAVAGMDDSTAPGPPPGVGTIFRLQAGTWLSGAWEDTTAYLGWDTSVMAIIACEFSLNFDIDDTIVCLGVDGAFELWKEKNTLITDMNSIIDQAKFIGDIEQYWTNVRECVNFENSDIGKELSIVSEQTKTRLSQAMNNIKLDDKEPELVVVNASTSGFSLVN